MKLFHKAEKTEKLVEARQLTIDAWLCHACGACVGICPTNALFLFDLTLRVNQDRCSQCGTCARACPVGALSLREIAAIEEGA